MMRTTFLPAFPLASPASMPMMNDTMSDATSMNAVAPIPLRILDALLVGPMYGYAALRRNALATAMTSAMPKNSSLLRMYLPRPSRGVVALLPACAVCARAAVAAA